MAVRKALVLVAGQIQQLQAGDSLGGPIAEVEVASLTNNNAGAIVVGQAVYIAAADAIDLAKADASATAKAFGFVQAASIAAGAVGAIQTDGILAGLSGLTAGADYYLSPTTAGAITSTAPSTTGQYVVPVGRALSTTELAIDIQRPILL